MPQCTVVRAAASAQLNSEGGSNENETKRSHTVKGYVSLSVQTKARFASERPNRL